MKNRLEEIRKNKGIKQEELADALEVSRQTIGSLENGRYNPSIILAFKIARYFKMSIEDIFIYEEWLFNMEKQNVKNIQKILFKVGTIIEIVTVFIYAIIQKDIVIFIGFPIAVVLMLLSSIHKKTPQEKKLEQIELHDERNIAIRDKAQSRTNLVMVYIALIIIIVLAIIHNYKASMMVSIAVIVDNLLISYFTSYYNKRF